MTLYIKYIMTEIGPENEESVGDQGVEQEPLQQSEYYQQRPRPGTVSKEVFLEKSECTQWRPKTYYSFGAAAGEFRFIILVLGPMGSGKSSIVKYMKAYAKILKPGAIRATKGEWVIDAVNHDHFITQSPQYKQEFNTIFPIANVDDTNAPSEEQTQQLNNAYQTVRKGHEHDDNTAAARRHYGFSSAAERIGVADPSTLHNPGENSASSIQVYGNLRKNIKAGNNIIYEATGEGWGTLKKIFETVVLTTNNCAKYKYIVLASMNLIDVASNGQRIISRFVEQKKKYDEWRHGNVGNQPPIPRLPHYDDASVRGRNRSTYKMIQNIVQLCTYDMKGLPVPLGQCDGVGIDLLFIFDNRGDRVYDDAQTLATPAQRKTPIFIIPLSTRSRWITRMRQGQPLEFSPSERTKFDNLISSFTDHDGATDGGHGNTADAAARTADAHAQMLDMANTREWIAPLLVPPARRRKRKSKKRKKKKRGGRSIQHSKRRRKSTHRSRRRGHKQRKTCRRKRAN